MFWFTFIAILILFLVYAIISNSLKKIHTHKMNTIDHFSMNVS